MQPHIHSDNVPGAAKVFEAFESPLQDDATGVISAGKDRNSPFQEHAREVRQSTFEQVMFEMFGGDSCFNR